MFKENYGQPCWGRGDMKFDIKSIKTSKSHFIQLYCWFSCCILQGREIYLQNKATMRNVLEQKRCHDKPCSPLQLSGMVCDHFAESSSHHLQSLRIPYLFFLMYIHTRQASGNQKQIVLNCKPCRLLESPCHLFASQMFIISNQVCGCKTKGTLGKK